MRASLPLVLLAGAALALAGCAGDKDDVDDPQTVCAQNDGPDPRGPFTAQDGVRVRFDTTIGEFTVQTDAEHAPLTVANFLRYVDDGFYACTIFHRVGPEFVAQGGGMLADGTEKTTRGPIPLEATPEASNVQGTLSMARTGNPDSATSQFFLNLVDNSACLDAGSFQCDPSGRGYAVFARVVDGDDTVEAFKAVAPGKAIDSVTFEPATPIVVLSARRVLPDDSFGGSGSGSEISPSPSGQATPAPPPASGTPATPPATPPSPGGAGSVEAANAACRENETADPRGPFTAQDKVRVRFNTTMGSFVVETDAEHAEKTVANFLRYVDEGFYACTTVHRLAPNFVVQGGGYLSDHRTLKPTHPPIPLEATTQERNVAWSLSMARTGQPDSATSQFFVNLKDNTNLDPTGPGTGYAVFAHLVEGEATVRAMLEVERGAPFGAGGFYPAEPIVILDARRVID